MLMISASTVDCTVLLGILCVLCVHQWALDIYVYYNDFSGVSEGYALCMVMLYTYAIYIYTTVCMY